MNNSPARIVLTILGALMFTYSALADPVQPKWVLVCPDAGEYCLSDFEGIVSGLIGVNPTPFIEAASRILPEVAGSNGVDLASGFRMGEGRVRASDVNFGLLRCGLEKTLVVAQWENGYTAVRAQITTARRRQQWEGVYSSAHAKGLWTCDRRPGSFEPRGLMVRVDSSVATPLDPEVFERTLSEALNHLPSQATSRSCLLVNGMENDSKIKGAGWRAYILNRRTVRSLPAAQPVQTGAPPSTGGRLDNLILYGFLILAPFVATVCAGLLAWFVMRRDSLRVWVVLKSMFSGERRVLGGYIILLAIPPVLWGFLGLWAHDIGVHHAMKTALRFLGGGLILYAVVFLGILLFVVGRRQGTGGKGVGECLKIMLLRRLCNGAFLQKGALTSIALLFFFLGFSLVGVHFTNTIGVGLFPIYAILMSLLIEPLRKWRKDKSFFGARLAPPEAASRWDAAGIICLVGMAVCFFYALTGSMALPGNIGGAVCVLAYGLIWVTRNRLVPAATFEEIFAKSDPRAKVERVLTGAAEAGTMFFWGAIFLPIWVILFQRTAGLFSPEIAVWSHEFWKEVPRFLDLASVARVGVSGWVGLVLMGSAVAYLLYEAAVVWHDAEAEKHRVTCRGADWNNMLGGVEPFVAVGVSYWLLNEYLENPIGLVGIALCMGGFLWFRLCKLADDLFVGMRSDVITRTQQTWNDTRNRGTNNSLPVVGGNPAAVFSQHLAALAGSDTDYREALIPSGLVEVMPLGELLGVLSTLDATIRRDWQRDEFGFQTTTGWHARPRVVLVRQGKRLFSSSLDLGRPIRDFLRLTSSGPVDIVWGEELRTLPGYAGMRFGHQSICDNELLLDRFEKLLTCEPVGQQWKYDNRYDSYLIAYQHLPSGQGDPVVLSGLRDLPVAAYVPSVGMLLQTPFGHLLQLKGYEDLLATQMVQAQTELAPTIFCSPSDIQQCRTKYGASGSLILPFNFNRKQVEWGTVYAMEDLWSHIPITVSLQSEKVGIVLVDDDEVFIDSWSTWQKESGNNEKGLFVMPVSSVLRGIGRPLEEIISDVWKGLEALRGNGVNAAVVMDRYMPHSGEKERNDDRLCRELYQSLTSRFIVTPLVASKLNEGIPDAQVLPKCYPEDADKLKTALLRRLVCQPIIARLLDEAEWRGGIGLDVDSMIRSGFSELHISTGLAECDLLNLAARRGDKAVLFS